MTDGFPKEGRRREGRLQGGFTLLEMIVVISILAIILGFAIQAFQRFAVNTNLRTAAQDIVLDFGNLKQRALSENLAFSVDFNPGANQYVIQQGGLALATKTPASFGPDIVITNAVFAGGTTINFLTRGTSQPSGTINLTNGRGSTALIRMNPTGRASVQFNMQ